MQTRGQYLLLAVLSGIVGGLWLQPWLEAQRGAITAGDAANDLTVTNDANSGPGTLREAVFRALRATHPVEIVLQVAQIRLETPLPPLASTAAIVIRSGKLRTTIVAPESDSLPVLDIRRGNVRLENLEIRGAASHAIQVSSDEPVHLANVRISDSLVAVGGIGDFDLYIDRSELLANDVGVELLGAGSATIRGTTFNDDRRAGIWAIGKADGASGETQLSITDSRISGGGYGVVAANSRLMMTASEISAAANDGVLVLGGSSELEGNQIWNGAGAAIRSISPVSHLLRANDIHENSAMGILLQSAASARVEGNRVYRNGYGIVSLHSRRPESVTLHRNLVIGQRADGLVAIGDSPIISANTALSNQAAGIRIFNLIMPDRYVASSPLLLNNVLSGNGSDGPVWSEYKLDPTPLAPGAAE